MRHSIQTTQSGRFALCLGVAICLLLAWTIQLPLSASAQPSPETEDEEASVEEKFPNGASVNTDPEVDRYLRLAQQYSADSRFRPATRYLQRILSDFADVMVTRREWFFQVGDEAMLLQYKPVRLEVERMLAKLPAEGLQIYRLSADADAAKVLAAAAPDKRREALANVVRRYFISSLGDDAAFELGCLMLEDRNFIRASYLFRRVLEAHPDPSVPLDAVRARLAVATARSGDVRGARKQIEKLARLDLPETVMTAISDDVEKATAGGPAIAASSSWPMALGNPSRTGHMKSLRVDALREALTEKWAHSFQIQLAHDGKSPALNSSAKKVDPRAAFIARGHLGYAQQLTKIKTRSELVKRWKERGWTPTGRLKIHNGRVYTVGFYSDEAKKKDNGNYVLCLDAMTGEMLWRSFNGIPSEFAPMPSSGNTGTTADEVRLFGDSLSNAISVIGDTVFAIQGPDKDPANSQPSHLNKDGIKATSHMANSLAAYHAISGKHLGKRSKEVGEDGDLGAIRFLAAPVPYGNLLLCPVRDDTGLWLMALDGRIEDKVRWKNKTLWKAFLCDKPTGGASPWGTVGVSVEGGDAYVATGSGLVFALDAGTGETRWAVRYRRSKKAQQSTYAHHRTQWEGLGISGWDEDTVIPWRNLVIILPSDANVVYGFDRRTGEINFKAPRSSKDGTGQYCLGVLDNVLYVGGSDVIRSYSLPGGRMIEQFRLLTNQTDDDLRRYPKKTVLGRALGRACITDKAIYVPVEDRVLQLDPKTLETVAETAVTSLSDDPVGNLYTDGTQIYGIGMERIYALMDIGQLLDSLAKKIAAGDIAARFDRIKVRGKLGKTDDALADLEAAYDQYKKNGALDEGRKKLHEALAYLGLPEKDPVKSLAWLLRSEEDIANGSASAAKLDTFDPLLLASLEQLAKQQPAGSVHAVFSIAKLLDNKAIQIAAQDALSAVATAADVDTIRSMLKHDAEHARAMSAQAIVALLKKDAVPDLLPLLDDDSETVKMTAARWLANEGKRESLAALEKLLESPSIDIRVRAAKTLRSFTGRKFGFVAYEKDDRRAEAVKKWREWIAASGATAELKFPLPAGATEIGRTLVCLYSRSRLIEIDSNGTQVWPKNAVAQISYPWDCKRLPNGNRLAVSVNSRMVAEFDESGRRVWYKEGLPNSPRSVQRLPNGNTLIACLGANRVMEISGKSGRLNMSTEVKWDLTKIDGRAISGRPSYAQRLENGNTLIAMYGNGRVVEVDREGRKVWEITGLSRPVVCRRLDNGNTLVTLEGSGEVVEFTHGKKPILRIRGLSTARSAQRTPRGTTIVSDAYGLREFDRQGKQISKKSILRSQTGGFDHY